MTDESGIHIFDLGFESFYSGRPELANIFDKIKPQIPTYDPEEEDYLNTSVQYNPDVFLAGLLHIAFHDPDPTSRINADKVWKYFNILSTLVMFDYIDPHDESPLFVDGVPVSNIELKDELQIGFIEVGGKVTPVIFYPFNFVQRSENPTVEFLDEIRNAINNIVLTVGDMDITPTLPSNNG